MKSTAGLSLSSASPGTYVFAVGVSWFSTGGAVSRQNGKLNMSIFGL